MMIEIREEPVTILAEYAEIPIAFTVDHIVDVTADGNNPGRFILSECRLETSYIKDYDAIDGEGPTLWPRLFDLSNWGILVARVEGQIAGGAAIAFNTPGCEMLEGRSDLALLWDIRVAPMFRGRRIGAALFREAEQWAVARGCRQLKVETQNINAPACRFYARQGCVLGEVNPQAYPGLPEEIQLLWYKDISKRSFHQ
jgi:GNAT superfamily N-acetyltransferase